MLKRNCAFYILILLFIPGPAVVSGLEPVLHHFGQNDRLQHIWINWPALATTVYARDGSILGYLYREKRFHTPLASMPAHLLKAFLAAEDSAFYQHDGIDLAAIFRALSKNIRAGDIVQGGSTITQQLVRRLMLSAEKSYVRKIKEAILAYRLEQQMSKDQILAMYLNQIFFGAGAYGVEAAARTYFGKSVKDLSLAESSLLAGLPKAPSTYNPLRSPAGAKTRQAYVLKRMLALDWITAEEYEQALAAPLEYKSMQNPTWKLGAYYLEEVRQWLIKNLSEEKLKIRGMNLLRYGEDAVYESGLHVYTALDPIHQRAAEQALRRGLEESARRRGWFGPIRQIKAAGYDAFLRAQAEGFTPGRELEPGDWVQALVVGVSAQGAEARVGTLSGFIDVATMGWCRKPDPRVVPASVPQVIDARQVLTAGDVVWTTVRAVTQKGLSLALTRRPDIQGALISMDPHNGEVLALTGGYDFSCSQFNRATQAKRPPGSLFKPVVYSAAIDHGYTAASIVLDAPWSIRDAHTLEVWKPKNASGRFSGPMLLRTALVKSSNVVSARVANKLGMGKVIKRAKLMGIAHPLPPLPAVSLGAAVTTPLEMCRVYSTFARGGTRIEPRLVLSVYDRTGNELLHTEPEATRALTAQNAYIITYLLKEVVQHGTGWRAKGLKRPVAGKTGTTNAESDAWFIGFTPYLLTAVYVGFDDGKPMGRWENGSRAACPIWVRYRRTVEESYPVIDFPIPADIVFERVSETGAYLGPGTLGEGIPLPFLRGTEPSLVQPVPQKAPAHSEDLETILWNSEYQKGIITIFKQQKSQ